MPYVTTTAIPVMIKFSRMRRGTAMPEMKATIAETATIIAPAVTIVGSNPVAPKSTGRTGTTAPAK